MKEISELEHRCNVLVEQINLFGFTEDNGFDDKWYVRDHQISTSPSGEKVSIFSTRREVHSGMFCRIESGTIFCTYFNSGKTIISHMIAVSVKFANLASKINAIREQIGKLNLPKPVLINRIDDNSEDSISIGIIGFEGDIRSLSQLDLLRVIADSEETGLEVCKEVEKFL